MPEDSAEIQGSLEPGEVVRYFGDYEILGEIAIDAFRERGAETGGMLEREGDVGDGGAVGHGRQSSRLAWQLRPIPCAAASRLPPCQPHPRAGPGTPR